MNFIPLTSLPRTGSTLLLYLLNQNPIFEIGPDSEIGGFLYHNKNYIKDKIHHFQLPHQKVDECFEQFCRKGTEAWINQLTTPDKIFVDKSRHWLKDLDYHFRLFPDNKVLITIRDLRGIVNSFEKINNTSYYVDRQDFHHDMDASMQFHRVSSIFDIIYVREGLYALKELIDLRKRFTNQIKICRYEDLISNPHKLTSEIYDFLELPQFEHDFNSIKQGSCYDNPYQPYGDHKIKESISPEQQSYSELDDDAESFIINKYHWYYSEFYPEVLYKTLL